MNKIPLNYVSGLDINEIGRKSVDYMRAEINLKFPEYDDVNKTLIFLRLVNSVFSAVYAQHIEFASKEINRVEEEIKSKKEQAT